MAHTGIILMNLGGPDSLQAVKPFLQNLFFDEDIIRLPKVPRWILSRLIAALRVKKAQKIYERLGGASPLLKNTKDQEQALQRVLGPDFKVLTLMRHWHPRVRDVLEELKKDPSLKRVVLLPLYPQFSTTTTRSSFKDFKKALEKTSLALEVLEICCYPTESGWILANAELALPLLIEAFDYDNNPLLLYSAHGIPQDIVDSGDPYAYQVEQTAKHITDILREKLKKPFESVVSYQSRVGPKKWLGPDTVTMIEEASRNKRPLVVLPIAFVSDHSETLVELDMDYKDLAKSLGCPNYARVPVVATHPLFINGLKDLVLEKIKNTPTNPICHKGLSQCPCLS